jgi:hypothetical protein
LPPIQAGREVIFKRGSSSRTAAQRAAEFGAIALGLDITRNGYCPERQEMFEQHRAAGHFCVQHSVFASHCPCLPRKEWRKELLKTVPNRPEMAETL